MTSFPTDTSTPAARFRLAKKCARFWTAKGLRPEPETLADMLDAFVMHTTCKAPTPIECDSNRGADIVSDCDGLNFGSFFAV